ncbi:MAG: PilZ domain-containing protein [Spirochaetales bacterium]|nr:PilZ domain-containing protein [Spirochaetales bacterium]
MSNDKIVKNTDVLGNKKVGYKSKPLLIEIFALIYLLNPIGNLLSLLYFNMQYTPRENLMMLMRSISDGNIIVIINVLLWISAIPLAYGLYSVHLWAWYYFIFHSVSMVVISLFDGVGQFAPSYATLINVIFLTPIGYFISKEIRTPYFNPSTRWWKQATRFHHVITVEIDGKTFETYDLSDTGAFIMSDKDAGFMLKELYPIRMELPASRIECFAEIIWYKAEGSKDHPAGYGIKFAKMTFSDNQNIKKYMKSLQNIGKEQR